MPRHAEDRVKLEPIDQDSRLVVHGEVHRADQPIASAGAHPPRGGVQQRFQNLGIVLELEEAEVPPAHPPMLVESAVDLRSDPAHDSPPAPREEVLRLGMLEVRIQPAGQELVALELERRNPGGSGVELEREGDELPELAKAPHRFNINGHGGAP
jgi:hypothetical protein